jgi:hypothetical protein
VKARKVKGVDPTAPLADGAERIVRVRLDELCSFMPRALDDTNALHDMRIAAKRLRYALEATGGCFGPYASTAIKHVKAIQDVLGEIHDADEHLPEVRALRDEALAADAAAAAGDPAALEAAPNRAAWPGLLALEVHLRGRRDALLADFGELWQDLERKGFRSRLEYALTERSHDVHEAPPPGDIISSTQ